MQRRALISVAIVTPLFGLIALLQASIDARQKVRIGESAAANLIYMPSRQVMKALALGHESTLADLLYIQSINYIMQELERSPNPLYLRRLFETIVSLDPQYPRYYATGSILLSAVAERHQDSLDLLAMADGRRYQRQLDGTTAFLGTDAETSPPWDWQRFRDPFLAGPPAAGALHRDNPRRPIINRTRAGYFVVGTRELPLAGEEFLAGARQKGLSDFARETWQKIGEDFLSRTNDRGERERLIEILTEIERNLADTSNEAVKKTLEARRKEVESRIIELLFEGRVAELKARGLIIQSVSELVQLAGLEPPPDPFGLGYVLSEDGKVCSPGRLCSEARRSIRQALRRYEQQHGRKRPASLKAAGVELERFDPRLRILFEPGRSEPDDLKIEFLSQ